MTVCSLEFLFNIKFIRRLLVFFFFFTHSYTKLCFFTVKYSIDRRDDVKTRGCGGYKNIFQACFHGDASVVLSEASVAPH